jgi:hypothetical protein
MPYRYQWVFSQFVAHLFNGPSYSNGLPTFSMRGIMHIQYTYAESPSKAETRHRGGRADIKTCTNIAATRACETVVRHSLISSYYSFIINHMYSVVLFDWSTSWGARPPDPPEQVQGPESLRMLLIPVIVVTHDGSSARIRKFSLHVNVGAGFKGVLMSFRIAY